MKAKYQTWILTADNLVLGCNMRGNDRLLRWKSKRGIPKYARGFETRDEAESELRFMSKQGHFPLWTEKAKPSHRTWS